ncbi:MAG: ABC transporter substrate-binding protein [Clostridiales bacterium]|nr:ABC transporter substrate-binding protein [Clostridiales bacterium]
MKRLITLFLSTMIILFSTGCGEKENNEGTNLEQVTVILDYLPNTNHTGIYAALELGYYEDLGLDVRIVEPADGVTATLVAEGKGQFGISYQEDVIYALDCEEPLPIKAISTIIQHNTSGFASYKDKDILGPEDFNGKVYAGWGAPSEEAVIKAVMDKAGADFSSLSMVTSDGSGYSVLKDKVDIMWFFWAWDGIASELAGVPVNYIELKELDPRLDYYTPVIITNNNIIENNPDLAGKFMEATSKGYKYAIENPIKSAGIIHKYAPEYDLEMLTKSQLYLSEKYSEGSEVWGLMTDNVWQNYMEFMKEYALIENEIQPQDCYTNQFIPEVYYET